MNLFLTFVYYADTTRVYSTQIQHAKQDARKQHGQHSHARARTHTHARGRARTHAHTRTRTRTQTRTQTHSHTHTHTHARLRLPKFLCAFYFVIYFDSKLCLNLFTFCLVPLHHIIIYIGPHTSAPYNNTGMICVLKCFDWKGFSF